MDELEEYSESKGVNFIPCLKFIQRGVAKPYPDKVSLDFDIGNAALSSGILVLSSPSVSSTSSCWSFTTEVS